VGPRNKRSGRVRGTKYGRGRYTCTYGAATHLCMEASEDGLNAQEVVEGIDTATCPRTRIVRTPMAMNLMNSLQCNMSSMHLELHYRLLIPAG
jgi:hypothetical protein